MEHYAHITALKRIVFLFHMQLYSTQPSMKTVHIIVTTDSLYKDTGHKRLQGQEVYMTA